MTKKSTREEHKDRDKLIKFLVCFTPFLIVLIGSGWSFRWLTYGFLIVLMGGIIYPTFIWYKGMLNAFMTHSYEELILKTSIYYLLFIINVFLLTLSISVIFYNENTQFFEYSYPALVVLCISRILVYRKKEIAKDFFEVIHGLVSIVLGFLIMKTFGNLGNIELLKMSFLPTPNITFNDILIIIMLTISTWAFLSLGERLRLIRQPRNKHD